MGNKIAVTITKKMEIIMSIKVCLVSQMNINYKENSGRKALLANPKHQYRVSQGEKHDCSAHNKDNGDYYDCPSLSYFMDKN